MSLKKVFGTAIILIVSLQSFAQDIQYKRTTIRTYAGAGIYEGQRAHGMGLIYSIGYQKTNRHNPRLRLNPQLTLGGFQPLFITDIPDQLFRITNLSYNAHYDFIKYKPINLVIGLGVFGNYTRGLRGTGGRIGNRFSEHFYRFYYGGTGSLGIRVHAKKVVYDFRPINAFIGNKGLGMGFMSFGIEIKLKK